MPEKETENYIHEHPSVTESVLEDSVTRTYRWETPTGESIFLYLTLTLKNTDDESFLFATTNLDSSSVKGQGDYLWNFLQNELQTIASSGLHDIGAIKIVHEVTPNTYSLRLVQNNPQYHKKGNSYYAVFQ